MKNGPTTGDNRTKYQSRAHKNTAATILPFFQLLYGLICCGYSVLSRCRCREAKNYGMPSSVQY